MEAGNTSDQHLSASNRQLQALTANIQELARQNAFDRQEMQGLARQNQELITLLRLKKEVQIPNPSQNDEGNLRHEERGNRNQSQDDEGSFTNQNR